MTEDERTRVRVLDTAEELLQASGHHRVVTLDVGSGFGAPAFAVGPAGGATVAFHHRSDHGIPGSAVLGTASGLAVLLADARVRAWVLGGGNRHLSVPRGSVHVVEECLDLGTRGGEWDWMWTTSLPPTVPGESVVGVLAPTCADETKAFLAEHSPRTHGQPFARPGQHWVAVRDARSGALVATGCSEPCAAGTPTLAGIAVDGARRGEGWGAAVTAHLTRRAVTDHGACALGMFADNDGARHLYERLGFTTGMQWTSRWFE
ncbi:MAG: GNAT family N-acetyltransferase [Ornithinibacter sp.]